MMTHYQPRHKYVLVGGHRLAYLDEGSGPPVLLIHGIPTSSLLWRQAIPVLAALKVYYRIDTPLLVIGGRQDLPGFQEPHLRQTFTPDTIQCRRRRFTSRH